MKFRSGDKVRRKVGAGSWGRIKEGDEAVVKYDSYGNSVQLQGYTETFSVNAFELVRYTAPPAPMALIHKVSRINANTRQSALVPGWLEMQEVGDSVAIQWQAQLPDNLAPVPKDGVAAKHLQKGRRWLIESSMTDNQIVNTILLAQLAFMEHEIREGFTYYGERPYMPRH